MSRKSLVDVRRWAAILVGLKPNSASDKDPAVSEMAHAFGYWGTYSIRTLLADTLQKEIPIPQHFREMIERRNPIEPARCANNRDVGQTLPATCTTTELPQFHDAGSAQLPKPRRRIGRPDESARSVDVFQERLQQGTLEVSLAREAESCREIAVKRFPNEVHASARHIAKNISDGYREAKYKQK
jgi:hypothetical protein